MTGVKRQYSGTKAFSTLNQWIVKRRMFEARQLLLKTDLPIYKIAKIVGYFDTGHFVKYFGQLHKHPSKA